MDNCLTVLFPAHLPAMLRLSELADRHTLTDTVHDKTQLHFKFHVLSKCEFFTAIPRVLYIEFDISPHFNALASIIKIISSILNLITH